MGLILVTLVIIMIVSFIVTKKSNDVVASEPGKIVEVGDTCPACGHALTDDDIKCPSCGLHF